MAKPTRVLRLSVSCQNYFTLKKACIENIFIKIPPKSCLVLRKDGRLKISIKPRTWESMRNEPTKERDLMKNREQKNKQFLRSVPKLIIKVIRGQ